MKFPTRPSSLCGSVLSAAILATSGLASAATYTLSLHAEADLGKYFAAPHDALTPVLNNYHVKATSAGGTRFWTFCLESQEYFENDRIYSAELSSSTDSLSGRDPVSVGTAFLYEQFALGQLDLLVPGFTYDVPGGVRLQQMIWWLEEEVSGVQDPAMWSLLNSTFGSSALDDYAGSAIRVLNLTRYDGVGGDTLPASFGTARQDQLVFFGPPNKVPDTSATWVMLGLALGGLGIMRHCHPATSRTISS